MKKSLRITAVCSSLALLSVCLILKTSAQGLRMRSILPLSPVSGSVLVAQAIHSGKLHRPFHPFTAQFANTLTCSPAPCALPNVQASEGGSVVDETPIAASPTNSSRVLTGGNDYNCANIQGFFASSDGGSTWNHTCLNSIAGDFGEGDPGVGYDRVGNAFISGIDASHGIVFEHSNNNGTTWSTPMVAVPPLFSGGLTDKPWLQVDTNRTSPNVNALYISVTQFDSSQTTIDISVSHSLNHGTTWSTSTVATGTYPTINQFSDLAVGKDGTVYLTWMQCVANGPTNDCGGTSAAMMFSKSTDAGTTWSTPVVMANVNLAPDTCGAFYGCLPNTFERVSNIPAIGVDNSSGPHSGNLYVVMYNWTGTQLQVEVISSQNSGTTWGLPVKVAGTAVHDQFFPWLNVSQTGIVGVTWMDRRNDPSNINYQEFSALSFNGGASFGRNTVISTASSDPFNDGFGGSFMGDYSGNSWSGKTLFASWTDTRTGIAQDEVGGFFQ
ncbi:MAG TPA: sialidase family protein [Terriglobia bacterium]|nr:sialidase family protein [Terriglobia bacterium]